MTTLKDVYDWCHEHGAPENMLVEISSASCTLCDHAWEPVEDGNVIQFPLQETCSKCGAGRLLQCPS